MILRCIAWFLFLVSSANAQTLTSSVETTTIDIPEANLSQLFGAINHFHRKEVEMSGVLFSTAADDLYHFYIDENLTLMIDLDDGRKVSAQASKCDDEIHPIMANINGTPIPSDKGCEVTMTVQVDVDISVNTIWLKGTGFDVVFLD